MNRKCIKFKDKNIKRTKCFIPECFEHALISYGETIGEDFYKIFCCSWNFYWNNNEEIKIIGKRLNWQDQYIDLALKYIGHYIEFHNLKSADELVDIVEKNVILGKPTLIHLDTFYSSWGMLYLKEHTDHIGVAVGVDRENNKVIIVDPDYSSDTLEVDMDFISKSTRFYLTIVKKEEACCSYMDILLIFKEDPSQYIQFEKMKDFADSFYKDFQPKLEFGNERDIDKVLDSKLILELRNIIKGRNMFIVFLEQVSVEVINVEKVIEYLTISLGKWNTVLNLLFKWSQTGWKEGFRDKIKTIIYEIIDIEKSAYNLLIDEIEHLDINKEEYVASLGEVKVKNIDIIPFCNNKGFCGQWDGKADLTGVGEYFCIVENIDELCFNGTNFKLYFKEVFDNIICKGQKITLECDTLVKYIDILLCSEWGETKDGIIVEYIDGTREQLGIIAYDISDLISENTVYLGSSMNINGDTVNERAGITYNHLLLAKKQVIKSIILPESPLLHILSIQLGMIS